MVWAGAALGISGLVVMRDAVGQLVPEHVQGHLGDKGKDKRIVTQCKDSADYTIREDQSVFFIGNSQSSEFS